MKHFTTLLIFIIFILNGFSQKITEKTHREINLHFPDSSISTHVLISNKKVKIENKKKYYWYYNNAIHQNQGGYKGHLLDGIFQVMTKHGGLIAQGGFINGVKNGNWKHWDEEGQLTANYEWGKGAKEGAYSIYQRGFIIEKGKYQKNIKNGDYQKFSNNKLIEKGTYKNGFLEGKVITYRNDSVHSKEKYKKGVLIVQKEKIKEDKEIKDKPAKKSWMFWKKDNKEKEGEKETTIRKEDKKSSTKKTKKTKKVKPEKKEKQKKGAKKSKKDA